MVRWLLSTAVLLNISYVLTVNHHDFDHVPDSDNMEFIYHENHHLLMALYNGSCYISDVSERGKQIMHSDESWALSQMKQHILQGGLVFQHHNVSYLTQNHHDLLADYHCFGKSVYNVDVQWAFYNKTLTS